LLHVYRQVVGFEGMQVDFPTQGSRGSGIGRCGGRVGQAEVEVRVAQFQLVDDGFLAPQVYAVAVEKESSQLALYQHVGQHVGRVDRDVFY